MVINNMDINNMDINNMDINNMVINNMDINNMPEENDNMDRHFSAQSAERRIKPKYCMTPVMGSSVGNDEPGISALYADTCRNQSGFKFVVIYSNQYDMMRYTSNQK